MSRHFLTLALAAALPLACRAADLPDYTQGVKWFPKFWKAYQMPVVPLPNLANGRRLLEVIHDGRMELSLAGLNQLVEENSLDLISAGYNVSIAETDVLRAKSGQAARGTPGVALPAEIFSSALGAGVGSASSNNTGGTGPAAISASGRLVVVGSRGTFDPDVQVTLSYDHATSPLNTLQVAGINAVATPSTDVLTRFEKEFSTGFSFSVSFNSQRQSSTQQALLFDPAYTSRLSISFNQPLLAGFGLAVNRRFLNIARNDIAISRQVFRQQVSTALVNAQNAYWDLVAARESVTAARSALATAEKLLQETGQQERLGASSYLDVITARSAMAGNRRDLVIAESNEKTRELALKALISKSLDTLADVEIATTDALPLPEDSDIPDAREALQNAFRNRSELIQSDLNLRNQEITEKFTRNSLKPAFSVFASYSSSALGIGAGPMLQQAWVSMPYPEYAAGFSLSIPLRNRGAQADNVRAQLELREQQVSRARTANQIRVDVQTAATGLMQARAQVEAAHAAADASRVVWNAEQKKLDVGASTPYRVVQAQRDWVEAQALELQARANYAKAQIQVDKASGQVLERNHVSLDEALSQARSAEKAGAQR